MLSYSFKALALHRNFRCRLDLGLADAAKNFFPLRSGGEINTQKKQEPPPEERLRALLQEQSGVVNENSLFDVFAVINCRFKVSLEDLSELCVPDASKISLALMRVIPVSDTGRVRCGYLWIFRAAGGALRLRI